MARLSTTLVRGSPGHRAAHAYLHAMCRNFDQTLPLDPDMEPIDHPRSHAVLRDVFGVSDSDHPTEHNLMHAVQNPGPREIAMPAGYTILSPGAGTWAATISAGSSGTHYWLPKGLYTLGAETSVQFHTDMIIAGELGAIIDGENVKANFYGNVGIPTGVEVQNLIMRGFTDDALNWNSTSRFGWEVHHNEFYLNQKAMNYGNTAHIHHNYMHDDVQYGFGGAQTDGVLIEWNELNYENTADVDPSNQGANKIWRSTNFTVRNNHIHDCMPWQVGASGAGVWVDTNDLGDGGGGVIEGNLIENNHQRGIFWEVSPGGTVRWNVLRGNQGDEIRIGNSSFVDVYGNYIKPRFYSASNRAIVLFQDMNRTEIESLHDNHVHDNTVDITGGVQSTWMTGISGSGAGFDINIWEQTKGNRFSGNRYKVLNPVGTFWLYKSSLRDFNFWRQQDRDKTGSIYT